MQSDRRGSAGLPYQLTSFVGRSVEVAELRRLLRERRLVTLTGPGGAGKTRLALETSAAVAPDFAGRAFLVDLAPLSRPELLLDSVARAFHMETAPARPLLDALADFLCDHPTLLILDNCEHLLDACADLAMALLAACPSLTVLATSREPLGVAGECTFRVPLLSFPEPNHPAPLDQMLEFEAIQLFVDRARLADPAFSLNEGNAAAVGQICAHLDGIPLALELAAGALRTASVSDIAARLDQRFRLLASSGRGALPRHQTLAALVDWSYARLDSREQFVFRQLGILPADWSLDAAEYLCTAEGPRDETLHVLLQLVNKSLVQVDASSGRYRLLETIRIYALEKLAAAGERERAARRLFEWYRDCLAQGAWQIDGPGQREWFLRLEREQANYRVALQWAIDAGLVEEAAGLALALWPFWVARAYHREALDWLKWIVARGVGDDLSAPLRACLLGRLGILSHTLNEFDESTRYLEAALKIWRELGDTTGIAAGLTDLAWLSFQKMDLLSAQRYAEEGLALARESDDPATIAQALQMVVTIWVDSGRFEGLRPLVEECLSLWRKLGARRGQAAVLNAAARAELKEGNAGRAATLMLEALDLLAPLGDYSALIEHLVLMTVMEFDLEGTLAPTAERTSYTPLSYLNDGRLRHDPVTATRVAAVMAAWQDRIMGTNAVQWNTLMAPICEKLEAQMGEAEFEREFSAGRSMNLDDIIAFAGDYARSVLAHLPPESGEHRAEAQPPGPARGTEARVPSPAARGATGGPDALTPREMEVLRLVADGLTNREVAERLVVTPRTVNAHLTSIYAKAGVTSRAAAVRFALERGLV
ncbi:MAG: LuxR C-terminal-related transcriptional regulator [Nitrososphaerales archaeon]